MASANDKLKSAAEIEGDELRCECGSLLARIVGDSVELKCRKCKRVVAIATITSVVSNHRPERTEMVIPAATN